MSDNGDGSVLELSSGELEGENITNCKYKCNLSSDNIPLAMGLNTEYCNNGGTSAGNLGLNFDESNLFQCDINGVFEWIRQRTDSVSSTDLDCMRIDSNEAIVTTSELTSSNEEEPVGVGNVIDGTGQLDPTFSNTVSTSLTSQSQSDHLSSTLLDELTCLQTDDQMSKTDPQSLINDSVFQYSLPQKEIRKFDNLSSNSNITVKNSTSDLSKNYFVAENSNTAKTTAEDGKSKFKILKCPSSLPFVKVPKKCILSGKILKKDAYLLTKNLLPTLSEQSGYEFSQEIQTAPINNDIEAASDFTSESLCGTGFENNEEIQLMLTEDRLKSPLMDENLQTNENEVLLSSCPDNQEKSSTKTVVAISTNKLEDVTEVCIKTEKGEELYKGKASELLKATKSPSNMLLRFDSNVKYKQQLLLHKSGSLSIETNLDESNADDEKVDDGVSREDEPITEALKTLGITNDQWDSFEVLKGQQRSWFCPVEECDCVFSKLSNLKVHILTHYKVRPFKCNYSGCEWSFYTNFRLKRHKETHLKKKEFKCTSQSCSRSFSTIYNLHTHLKLHDRPADLMCPVPGCGKAFQTRRNMESHLKEHGTEHAPYACTVDGCQKRYYSPSALHSHSRTHMHNINDLKCEYCSKMFDKPCRLKAHLRSHTGVKPYKCYYEGCDWAFTTSSKLHRHQAKHTQERRFVCNLCCKGFLRSEHLKDHTLKHFLTKAFVCPVQDCGQQFTAKSSLYVHLKKHRKKDEGSETGSIDKNNGLLSLLPNVIKLTCPIDDCKQVFSTKDEITAHIQILHKNINIEIKDLNEFDYIELMGSDDNLVSLEGQQFKNDSSVTGINLTSLGAEGVVISLPEFINTEFTGLSVLNTPSSISHVESSEKKLRSRSKDITCSDTALNNICTITRSDIGCARTGLTYQDAVAERELRKSLNKKQTTVGRKRGLVHSDSLLKDCSAVQVTSDIVLTAGLLGGSQENLTRGLMFQDELSNNVDLYEGILEDSNVLDNNGIGQFLQVFIVDSSGVKSTEFEQSTINLRDLD